MNMPKTNEPMIATTKIVTCTQLSAQGTELLGARVTV